MCYFLSLLRGKLSRYCYHTMTEDVTKSPTTPSKKEEKKKNVFTKIKEGIDDKEEQLVILSTFVRLGVVVWSGFIISLNYITFLKRSLVSGDVQKVRSLKKDFFCLISLYLQCFQEISL